MKINRRILKLSISTLLLLAAVSSCKKDDQGKNYSYYVSKEFVVKYTKGTIDNLIDLASIAIPDVAALKPQISSDVDVYKLVYKTTIDGNKINASGLICVPEAPGSYPVLSFQNGTNTVYANAPSVYPLNTTYELAEVVASMGYIVVIADYPGFGESTQIQHPYLVKEPTVRSLVDQLYAVKEVIGPEFPAITLKNEYYLLGYSQGGWATMALHKALELDYSSDFTLRGSACGAGPYDIPKLLENMLNKTTYPMPAYLAYITNAYIAYHQFTNPPSDILNEPYASRVSSLFNGTLTLDQINSQLTTSVAGLITPDFISSFSTAPKYSGVLDALKNNSVPAWSTLKPLLLLHGGQDTQVDPVSTDNMYNAMIQAGTSSDLIKKLVIPGLDHTDGAIPCMVQGLLFLNNLKNSN